MKKQTVKGMNGKAVTLLSGSSSEMLKAVLSGRAAMPVDWHAPREQRGPGKEKPTEGEEPEPEEPAED